MRSASATRTSAIVILSQYVEAGIATRLLAEVPERLGYLLKDRVTDAGGVRRRRCERVGRGRLGARPADRLRPAGGRRAQGRALERLTPREREVLAAGRRGPDEPGDRQPPRYRAAQRREARLERSSRSSGCPTRAASTAACSPCCASCAPDGAPPHPARSVGAVAATQWTAPRDTGCRHGSRAAHRGEPRCHAHPPCRRSRDAFGRNRSRARRPDRVHRGHHRPRPRSPLRRGRHRGRRAPRRLRRHRARPPHRRHGAHRAPASRPSCTSSPASTRPPRATSPSRASTSPGSTTPRSRCCAATTSASSSSSSTSCRCSRRPRTSRCR